MLPFQVRIFPDSSPEECIMYEGRLPAIDMYQHVLLYIKQGLKAQSEAFSPTIIKKISFTDISSHTLKILC